MRVFTALPLTHWREAGPAARAAEDIGFDVLRTAELGHEVFIPLAFAALATERVELTPSVAIAFPRSPTIMASIAWDLQANSRGRFVLGLGSQVKGHNERRFGIAWTPPAPRMRDYIGALRAIWRCWETGGKLDYHSDHYTLTLMTPAFSPVMPRLITDLKAHGYRFVTLTEYMNLVAAKPGAALKQQAALSGHQKHER